MIRYESYAYDEVRVAVQRGVDLLGGASAFAQPQETILLKPNWIVAVNPEKCATTHPAVFRAICDIFAETGCELTYGDSPGHNSSEEAARQTGFLDVAQEFGLPLADFENGEENTIETGFEQRVFTIANGALECDGIISMEGNGSMNGDPRKMNVLLFSTDPIALDATVCRIIDVKPEYSYTVTLGMQAGHGTYLEQEIELVGGSADELLGQRLQCQPGSDQQRADR